MDLNVTSPSAVKWILASGSCVSFEYCIQNLPEFEGKKFQNVAKEGLQFGDEGEREKERLEELEENYKPLTTWLKETALKDLIDKAVVSNRLTGSPCAIVASQYGWYVGVARIVC